jgi:hypothetical protein
MKTPPWKIEKSDEFVHWYRSLNEHQAESVDRVLNLLEQAGPSLGAPHVEDAKDPKHPELKHLHIPCKGKPVHIPVAPDPTGVSYMVVAGGTTSGDDWEPASS